MEPLVIRKLADQTVERVKVFDPLTGQTVLLDPEDAASLIEDLRPLMDRFTPLPRPFLGISLENDEPPKETQLSTRLVVRGKAEGWITVSGEDHVFRSSGPEDDPWGSPPHVFVHYDTITIQTVDGDLVYKVIEQPDKWPESEGEDEAGFGGEVKWFYVVELEE